MNPSNKTLVTNFGAFMVLCGVVSVLTGKTYFRRVIEREAEPTDYWITVVSIFFIGLFCLVGVWLSE